MTCRGRVSTPPQYSLEFPIEYQEKYLIGSKKSRSRIFSPQNLFLTLCSLVSGTNNCGYHSAILNSLSYFLKIVNLPVKSALSQIRQRISYKFFQDQFYNQNEKNKLKRKTWNGLYVYAVDGLQLTLPKSDDIIKANYNGRKVSKYRESYMPKMFLTAALDVINGVVKDAREYPTLNEVADAIDMVKSFEDNSLTIYDRLYCCRKLILEHNNQNNYFLFRLRKSVMQEMRLIFKCKSIRKTIEVDGVTIHLIKVKNPKTNEFDYFASNLPLRLVTEKTIRSLYNQRWEVEVAFRDFTQTIRLEEWHSKKINGIRQELWTAFWLYNYCKLKILLKLPAVKNRFSDHYQKPNFKLIFNYISTNIFSFLKRKRGLSKVIEELIDRTTEKRRRHSRSYKREIKSPMSPFPYNNTVWNI